MTEQSVLIYKDDDEVLAVHFEDPSEYGYIIIKDEPNKSIDGSWTVYSPLMDIHEEVIDTDELSRYIGQTITMYQPLVSYRTAEETGPEQFQAHLRELQDQAKIWDVQNKEGK